MSMRDTHKGKRLRRQSLREEADLRELRVHVKLHALNLGFSKVNRTRLLVATRELARNTILHGKGGYADVEKLDYPPSKVGIMVSYQDSGPGISDIEAALLDGYSTTGGFGLGLGGAKRLVDEFEINSVVGSGTIVTIIKWHHFDKPD